VDSRAGLDDMEKRKFLLLTGLELLCLSRCTDCAIPTPSSIYGRGNAFFLYNLHTGSGSHTAQGGGCFSGSKAAGGKAHHSPPVSVGVKRMSELYLHSQIRLHNVVLNLLNSVINYPFLLRAR
jgi:hypothetical protein